MLLCNGQTQVRFRSAAFLVLVVAAAAALPVHAQECPAAPPAALIDQSMSLEERLAAAATDCDRAAAWGGEGMLLHAQRRLHEARTAYQNALSAQETARWRYLHGVTLAETGAVEASVADFRRTVALAPDNMPAWYRLGTALLLSGEVEDAEHALQQAQRLKPESALVLSALSDVAVARDRAEQALSLLEAAFELEPEAGQLAYKIASLHRRLDDVETAQSWLQRDPGNRLAPTIDDPFLLQVAQLSRTPRFFRMAGDWALARGDAPAAIEAYRNGVTLAPGDAALRERLASALAEHAPSEALPEVETLLQLAPNSAIGWRIRAWLLRAASDTETRAEATAAASRSLALADDPATRVLVAAFAMRAGRFRQAQEHYRHLTATQPEQPRHHYWLAMSRLAMADCTGIPHLNQALRLRPEWGEAHLVLARAESICAQPSALPRSQTLLRARKDPDTNLTLAFALAATGETNAALQIAQAQSPHPDATMLLQALAQNAMPKHLFAPESPWWIPPELRPAL